MTWLHHRRWKQRAGARRSGAKGSLGVRGGKWAMRLRSDCLDWR